MRRTSQFCAFMSRWTDSTQWQRLLTPEGCPICTQGEPHNVIAELEGMDRGRYAGPVGWMDATGDGEWGLALRSAEVDGDRVRLFAGCGIVADSDPEAELAETELKLAALEVLARWKRNGVDVRISSWARSAPNTFPTLAKTSANCKSVAKRCVPGLPGGDGAPITCPNAIEQLLRQFESRRRDSVPEEHRGAA